MKTLRRVVAIAGVATLLAAPVAFAQATDEEFTCMQAVSKAGAKFVGAKAKCVDKCLKNFWKGITPEADCLPPYGGTTLDNCITDQVTGLKGAEDKFRISIQKKCDPGFKAGTDCPECYNGGDCSAAGFAGDQVQNIEGQIDSFVPGVACERAGADPEEQKCQSNTAKSLSKQVSGVVKCYDKCKKNERKGLAAPGSCNPPASDAATATCVSAANNKAILAVNKKCGDVVPSAEPDCGGPDNYPDGASWVNLVDIAISGQVPNTYCE
jgi:hypothetical protein